MLMLFEFFWFGLVFLSCCRNLSHRCLMWIWQKWHSTTIGHVFKQLHCAPLKKKKRKLLLALTENIYWVFLEDSQWGWRKTYWRQNGHWWDIFSILLCPHWIALIYFIIFPLRCSVGTLMFLLSVWRKLDSWVLIKIWLKPRSTGEFGHSDYEFEGCSSSHLLAHNHSFEWCLHFFKP